MLVNGQPVATQADVKNRYPDGSVEFAVIAAVIPAIPASGSLTLTFQNQNAGNNTPLTQAQMLASTYNFDASMALTPVGGTAQTASARTMLQNGDYQLWTSGPVAQTIMLGDDTTARKYDIGFGDGYHPFRPRFYATFWPATHQVYVRAVGENGLTTELEDLAYTDGPPRLQAVIARVSDQSAPTYPVSRTKPRPRWRSARPGSHNLVGVKRHVGHQISKPPFYCQAISLPPPANIVGHLCWFGAPARFPRLQGCSDSFSRFEGLSRAQYRPGDPCELVRQRHDDGVYMRPRS